MKNWIDYYSILQVHHEAEQEVIESAYKRLSKKYHPDLNPSVNTEEKMKLINLAYDILKDSTQRKMFHREWVAHNKSFKSSQTKTKSTSNDTRPMRIIKEYINYISNDKFREAYSLISQTDKANINLEQFYEWQKSVSSIYKIGNYTISHFKSYDNYHTKKQVYSKAMEFEIKTKEKNLLNGKINEYSFTKLVVYDRFDWRVFLGYEDLELLIHKFKFLADSKEIYSAMDYWTEYRMKTDETTSLRNRKGFIEDCEKELYRYLRYGRKFSFSMFNFNFSKNTVCNKDELENDYLKQVAYIMKNNIRDTDIIARWDKDTIIILYTETSRADAVKASKKIKGLLNNRILSNIITPKLSIAIVEHTGQDLKSSLKKCSNLLAKNSDGNCEKIS